MPRTTGVPTVNATGSAGATSTNPQHRQGAATQANAEEDDESRIQRIAALLAVPLKRAVTAEVEQSVKQAIGNQVEEQSNLLRILRDQIAVLRKDVRARPVRYSSNSLPPTPPPSPLVRHR